MMLRAALQNSASRLGPRPRWGAVLAPRYLNASGAADSRLHRRDTTFDVFNFARDGTYRRESLSVQKLMNRSQLHARDIIGLGATLRGQQS